MERPVQRAASRDDTATAPAPAALGTHVLVDMFDCDRAALDDRAALEAAAREAVTASGATLLGVQSHAFSPHGVTVLAMIAESHLSLHTWPEHGYLAFDYFTCGDRIRAERALEVVRAAIRPGRVASREVPRGVVGG